MIASKSVDFGPNIQYIWSELLTLNLLLNCEHVKIKRFPRSGALSSIHNIISLEHLMLYFEYILLFLYYFIV